MISASATAVTAASGEGVSYPRAVYEQNFDGTSEGEFAGFFPAGVDTADAVAAFGKTNFDTSKQIASPAGTGFWSRFETANDKLEDGEYQHVSYRIAFKEIGMKWFYVRALWANESGATKIDDIQHHWLRNSQDLNLANGTSVSTGHVFMDRWHQFDYVLQKGTNKIEVYFDGALVSNIERTAPEGYSEIVGVPCVQIRTGSASKDFYLDDFRSEIVNEKPVITKNNIPFMFDFDVVDGTAGNIMTSNGVRVYNNTAYINNGGGAFYKYDLAKGYKGKDENDTCIHLYNEAGTGSGNPVEVRITPDNCTMNAGDHMQISFDFYIDEGSNENTSKRFCYNTGTTLFREWRKNIVALGDTVGQMEYGKWYNLAFDFVYGADGGWTGSFYVNGSAVVTDKAVSGISNNLGVLRFAYDGADSANGIAVDNLMVRYSDAENAYSYATELASDTVIVDNGSKTISTLDKNMSSEDLLKALRINGKATIAVVDAADAVTDGTAKAVGNRLKVYPEIGDAVYYAINVNGAAYADIDFTNSVFNNESGRYVLNDLRSIQFLEIDNSEIYSLTKETSFGGKKSNDSAYILRGTNVGDVKEPYIAMYPGLNKKVVFEGEYYLDNTGLILQLYTKDRVDSKAIIDVKNNKILTGETVLGDYVDGAWIKLAIELDCDTNLANIYINGEKAGENIKVFDNDAEGLKGSGLFHIRVMYDPYTSANDKPADFAGGIDNIKIYQGIYDADSEKTNLTGKTNSFVKMSAEGMEVTEFNKLLPEGAACIISGNEGDTDYIFPGCTAAVYAKSGRALKVYTIVDETETAALEKISQNENRIVVQAQVYNESKGVQLLLASYNADGSLNDVKIVSVNDMGYARAFVNADETLTYKFMLWNSLSGCQPLTGAIK